MYIYICISLVIRVALGGPLRAAPDPTAAAAALALEARPATPQALLRAVNEGLYPFPQQRIS